MLHHGSRFFLLFKVIGVIEDVLATGVIGCGARVFVRRHNGAELFICYVYAMVGV